MTIPGNSRTVITVGAVDENGRGMSGGEAGEGGEPAGSMSYSGRGPTRECVVKLEILAPVPTLSAAERRERVHEKTGNLHGGSGGVRRVALMLEKDPAWRRLRSNFGCTSAAFRCDILTEAENWEDLSAPICFFSSRRTGGTPMSDGGLLMESSF